jgi:hypothetical protein
MRLMLVGLVCGTLLAVGCAHGPLARDNGLPTRTPTAQQLIAHLNSQAQAIQSIEYHDVSVSAKQGMRSFGVNGELAYQKPRNFRFLASAAGGTVADIGSNSQEFWFHFKDDGALYHCSYDDLPRVRNLRIPVHPDWIAEALCVKEFGPAEQYQVRTVGQTMEIHSQSATPQGQPVQKVTVVALAGQNHGRIVAHHVREADGKELWSAQIIDYQNAGGYWVPRRAVVRSPREQTEIEFRLLRCQVNRITPDRAALLFRRTTHGVQEIDLARGPSAAPQSNPIRRTGTLP